MSIHLKNLVYNYKTKYEQGFTQEEINELLSRFPKINMDKFNDALMGNTCMTRDGEIIRYHCDIYTALDCGISNRFINQNEFD